MRSRVHSRGWIRPCAIPEACGREDLADRIEASISQRIGEHASIRHGFLFAGGPCPLRRAASVLASAVQAARRIGLWTTCFRRHPEVSHRRPLAAWAGPGCGGCQLLSARGCGVREIAHAITNRLCSRALDSKSLHAMMRTEKRRESTARLNGELSAQ